MATRTKLDETHDFLTLYEYAAGEWTTPAEFHRWAGLSLIAACLADRVYLQIFDHAPLTPNIWVFLIGGSGVGKDHAIGVALSYLREEDPVFRVDGKITMPALYDYMSAEQKATGAPSVCLYIISSDVTEQLPMGPEAKDFTSRILSLYGGRDRVFMDITRTTGTKTLHKPSTNWIAGCPKEWFPNAIDPTIFHSGFAGRAFFIVGEPQMDYFDLDRPLQHRDKDAVVDYLRKRVEWMQTLEGLMIVEPQAQRVYDAWLMAQKDYAKSGSFTEVEKAVLNRTRASVQKLMMIFAVSNTREGEVLRVKPEDVSRAIECVGQISNGIKAVQDFAYNIGEAVIYHRIVDALRGQPGQRMRRTSLMHYMYRRGIRDARHMEALLDTLKQAGQIEVKAERPDRGGGGGRPAIWVYLRVKRVPFAVLGEGNVDA